MHRWLNRESKGAVLFVLLLAMSTARAQTTIYDIDQDPVSSPPTDGYNNNRSWSWLNGPEIGGCGGGVCYSLGDISHTSDPSLDGSATQLALNKIGDGCDVDCWSDVWFGNRIYHNETTADDASSFTLDLYLALDSNGISNSQAIEFNIEQAAQTAPGEWSRYVYSLQCDYKGSHKWRVWDGGANGGAGSWEETAADCVPPFPANGYDHYVFHFSRPSTLYYYYNDFWINDTQRVLNYQTHGRRTEPEWEDGLITWIQLDSDGNSTSYAAFADAYTITFQ